MPRDHVNNARFSRDDRLTKPSEFERVFKDPVKTTSQFFTVLACENKIGHSRLGLAISRKNIPLAVQRNRIKRLVRESFRHNRAQLGDIDLVVMARRGAESASRDKLRATLKRHWEEVAQKCAG